MDDALVVGIDVGQEQLVIGSYPKGLSSSFGNDPQGIADLVVEVGAKAPLLVVLESTGGYERRAALGLSEAEVPVVVVNPRCVRSFGKATGELAKTDKIDAEILAFYGFVMRPQLRTLGSREARELRALSVRRQQLIEMRSAEKKRRPGAEGVLAAQIERSVAWLTEQIDELDAEMRSRIESNADWRERDGLLQSIPGIGPGVSTVLVAQMPELGQMDRRQAAALGGLAPYTCDSGKHSGRRRIFGGRKRVRQALYMGAQAATRCLPTVAALYERLRAAGKPFKMAITACMRKLLVIANAVLRDRRPWSPDYAPTP